MCIYSALKIWSVRQPSHLNFLRWASTGALQNTVMRNDVILHRSDTEGEELGDKQYQDGLSASEVPATVTRITNTPKRKKKIYRPSCKCVSALAQPLVQRLLLHQLPSRVLVLRTQPPHSFLHPAETFFFLWKRVTSSKLVLGAVPGACCPTKLWQGNSWPDPQTDWWELDK